ncbi:MAG: energy-coupling factor transporter ATPase [Oscillospiraceae bacterium]|nr:energy-coupling factor transporter ATPase [Oscillospiraceae bacterium]MDD7470770.1 energy-coupling factor transporter ATPase [Oscillospiraceae bacterium]MDY2677404.1 energy-coupling factor transporter ATPase [Oscillospiraceae bacterium]
MEKIIEFKNVSFKYEDESENVLKGVSLELFSGQFTCILGHNGSGKSTLAKLMNALLLPTSGKVISFGYDTSDEKNEINVRKNVGMVFQNPDNQIVATIVEDDVAFGPENLGLPREEIRKRVDKALEITDMTAFKKSEPHKLSGGQKQRVAIAGAIAMRTKCIVLDEPTAMLDPKGRREVLAALKKLNKDFGIAVILVTHYMDEAVGADRVIVMNDGKVSLDGTPQEVFKNVEYLRSVGLDVPKPLELAKELEKRGVTIGENILTADDFVREFKKCIGE